MLNLLRFACLLLSLLAVGTGWVWQARSKWVYSAEWHINKRYERGIPQRLEALGKAEAWESPEATLKELEDLRIRTKSSEYGDRFFPFWRRAVELESQGLFAAGRYEQVVDLLKPALERDPNHLELNLRYAQALTMLGGSDREALAKEITTRWYRKVPNHPDVVSTRLVQLLSAGDVEGFVDSVVEDLLTIPDPLKTSWQVFAFGSKTDPIAASPLTELSGPDGEGYFLLSYSFEEPPSNLTRLRIDPPSKARAHLQNVGLVFEQEGEVRDFLALASEGNQRGFQSDQQGGYWLRRDSDPQIGFQLREPLSVRGPLSVSFRFQLLPALPEGVEGMLKDDSARKAVEAALARKAPNTSLADLCAPDPAGGK